MSKSKFWVSVSSTPILLLVAGCSIGNRPHASVNGAIPPERLMAMARTFERQGHLNQAKNAYLQVMAVQPNFPNAQQSYETLVASEMNQNRPGLNAASRNQTQIASRSTPPQILQSNPTLPLPSTPRVEQTIASPEKQIVLSEQPTVPVQLPLIVQTPKVSIPSTSVSVKTQNIPPLSDLPVAVEPVEVNSSPSPQSLEIASSDPFPSETTNQPTSDGLLVAVPNEVIEFVPPLPSPSPSERETPIRFDNLFGPFRIQMVSALKSNRAEFQPRLAQIACDSKSGGDDRSRAIFLLGAIGPEAVDVVPALRHQMHVASDLFLVVDLSEAILKIQPEDSDAINTLLACLSDSEQNVRWVAAFALRNAVSPRTTFVIDPLCDVLKTDDLKLKRMVFLTLAEFGPAAAKVIPELRAALESPDAATREVARASLECIAPYLNATSSTTPTTTEESMCLAGTRK